MATAPVQEPCDLFATDVARILGLSANTVRRLADSGRLRCLRIVVTGDKECRTFRRSWVEEFIAANTTAVEAQPARAV